MPPISRRESLGEVHRDRPVRRLRRTDVVDVGRRLGDYDRAAPVRRPLWFVALRLAPVTLCVFRGIRAQMRPKKTEFLVGEKNGQNSRTDRRVFIMVYPRVFDPSPEI